MLILYVVFALCSTLSFTCADQNISESEVLKWEAPEYLKTKFPYYLSGYDDDGSPVFILEAGSWDIRHVVEAGPETTAELDKWLTQMMLRMRTAGHKALGSPGAVMIIDIGGIGIAHFGHIGVLQFILKQFPKFRQLSQLPGSIMKKVYIINANYLYERVYETGKPMLGALANLVEIFGTNSAKWKPVLLKEIPAEELPAWYGGCKSHLPIEVYG